jgi:hypothetical protein
MLSSQGARVVTCPTNLLPVEKPEVLVTRAQGKFDAEGRLIDEETQGYVRRLLQALVGWTLQLRQKPE